MRHFLLVLPPPVELGPLAMINDQPGYLERFLQQELNQRHIRDIRDIQREFEAEHPESNVMVFDQDSLIRIVYELPELFGVTLWARYGVSIQGEWRDGGQMGLA